MQRYNTVVAILGFERLNHILTGSIDFLIPLELVTSGLIQILINRVHFGLEELFPNGSLFIQ